MKICVFGSSADPKNRELISKTRRLGEEIGRRGHVFVYGGGKNGLMGAAAIGADSAGGEIIAAAPAFMGPLEMPFSNCTKFVRTESMAERKELMEELADAFVAVPGGLGTLDELFEVITLKKLGLHSKPIAFFNPDGFYDGLIDYIEGLYEQGLISPGNDLGSFSDPKELVDWLESK